MSRFRTTRLATGAVIPSGLDPRPRGWKPPLRPSAELYRAIVINTYVTSDDASRSKFAVECDIILVNSNLPLSNVPVTQNQHGVNNVHDLWVPRPSTRTVATSMPVSLAGLGSRGQATLPPSFYGDLDGDQVLVGYVENDLDYPVILRALPHERTNRLVTGSVSSTGWAEGDASSRGTPSRNEFYTSHYGTEMRINASGDLLFDTVGAFQDVITEANGVNTGQVRIRVKNSQRFTVEMNGTDVLEVFKEGSQVRIDLGAGAVERVILGDAFRSFLNNFFTAIFDTHTHATGTGPSGPPMASFVAPVRQDMSDNLLSDLAKVKKS